MTPPIPESLDALTPDPKNARKHNERNLATIAASLADVGAGRSIVVDEAGVVLAGNATVEAAKAAGLKLRVVDTDAGTLIAVRRSDLTAEQKVRLALADNRSAELATWDSDILLTLRNDGVDLGPLWSAEELSELLGVSKPAGRTDPDAVPPPQRDRHRAR